MAYLTAFLNSKLFKFTFKDYFPELLGDTRELRKVFFENITIKAHNNPSLFESKLERIEELKGKGSSTEKLEIELDEMIFDLYELTSSERSIVLGKSLVTPLSDNSINVISPSVSEYI